ncbi:MAG TPA: TetR/AcrR family transcriptional regulator [Nocardioidaceae bacterium]|nr:TetR/AcrR family transcriptional regulator [Nocardioidaceae bacterium]
MLGNQNRNRRAERREATRREIVDAAWEAAREYGLAQITLRDIADRIGMQAPSLYSHMASKNAIYDAMFAQAWSECLELTIQTEADCPPDRRGAVRHYARTYFDFATADVVRNELMNQRTIPGFEPSPEAYAPSVAALDIFRVAMEKHGITTQEDVDLYVALLGGLVDSQLANDPGGDRWSRLLDRAVDMYLRDLDVRNASAVPHQSGRDAP